MKELETHKTLVESWGVAWEELMDRLNRPALDTPSTKAFWDDPHIASHMMQFHLDPSIEAASKRHATIDAECAFLSTVLDLKPGKTLVDLGCGPGLYLERWVKSGANLVGVDLSSVAISTAKARLSAPITWIECDYRHLPKAVVADAMTLIYYDFTALPIKDQGPLLKALCDHLRPGGQLALDVMTPHHLTEESLKVNWREGGFWSPNPHLEIHQVFNHDDPRVIIDQYTLVDQTGQMDSLRIQNRLLTQVELEDLLRSAGFEPVMWLSDLSGTPYHDDAKTLAVIAKKSHSDH